MTYVHDEEDVVTSQICTTVASPRLLHITIHTSSMTSVHVEEYEVTRQVRELGILSNVTGEPIAFAVMQWVYIRHGVPGRDSRLI